MAMGPPWLPPVLAVFVAGVYLLAARSLRHRGDRWPLPRCACAIAGLGMLTIAFTPPLATSMSFPTQVVQHLDMAMAAPLALALSAPATLALRTVPRGPRRLMVNLLHSRIGAVLTRAPVVLVLEVGGMYAYYLTGLFALAERHLWLHLLVHLHMFLAGCLLNWYIVARDPMPHRRSTRTALIVLFIAAGCHDLMAKLMYAHLLPHTMAPAPDIQLGAQIMFYGGDVIELTLAVALLTSWYQRTGRQLNHHRRRHKSQPVVSTRGSANVLGKAHTLCAHDHDHAQTGILHRRATY